MTAAAPSRMIRATEVADRMGLAAKTVRELARRGELPALRFGPRGHWLFDADAIEVVVRRGTASTDRGRAVDAATSAGSAARAARRGPATIEGDDR
jgi:excisionase family DNA binding protein